MSDHLSIRELEEIVDGAPAPVHTARCADCLRRLSFLRAERELLRRAAAEGEQPVEDLWPGVRARIASHRRNRRFAVAALAAAGLAALVLLVPRRSFDRGGPAPGARAALDHAESEYLHAIEVLESRVALREQTLPAATLEQRRDARARSRAVIAQARGREVPGRVRQLEGYAAYLRSLRRELEETP